MSVQEQKNRADGGVAVHPELQVSCTEGRIEVVTPVPHFSTR